MTRYMGLDFGTKTIGVALSDLTHTIAQAQCTIKRRDSQSDIEEIKKLISDNEVSKIVIGMPYNMDGSSGPSVQRVLSFVDLLNKQIDIPIIKVDERMTTILATNILIDTNIRRENRKEHVDKIAASYILQSYLDTLK